MYKHVLNPIDIGGVTVPNRTVRTAHATGIGGGRLTDDLIAYHEARARGGFGLTVLEILAVHPSSPGTLNAFDPTIGDAYQKLMDAIRPARHEDLPTDLARRPQQLTDRRLTTLVALGHPESPRWASCPAP